MIPSCLVFRVAGDIPNAENYGGSGRCDDHCAEGFEAVRQIVGRGLHVTGDLLQS